MRRLPDVLVVIAAIGIGIGLVVRLIQTASGAVRPAYFDPVFYWRGAMALLGFTIVILLVQIRDK
jgi:hypothetical protein